MRVSEFEGSQPRSGQMDQRGVVCVTDFHSKRPACSDARGACRLSRIQREDAATGGSSKEEAVHRHASLPSTSMFSFRGRALSGASLAYLVAQNFLIHTTPPDNFTVEVSPLVSILPKKRDGKLLVLDLRSVSSLTGSDYLRFSLHCGVALAEAVQILSLTGKARISELKSQGAPSSMEYHHKPPALHVFF
eukprot:symbB.v1.2.022696.t1/scaffold2012.1/size92363/7